MESYRNTFQSTNSSARYDEIVYAEGSVAAIWWETEKNVLERLIQEYFPRKEEVRYLDFACGTGRIIAMVEPHVKEATGIDISPHMLERAGAKVAKANLICKDVTVEDEESIEGKYDLITSFRFLANSEQPLRVSAVNALRRRMRDENSILLISNHGNPYSFRLLFLPYHWLKSKILGQKFYGYLTNRATRELLESCGFKVLRVIGNGFVPGKLRPFLTLNAARKIEQNLSESPTFQRFGVNQLFVCRLAPRAADNRK